MNYRKTEYHIAGCMPIYNTSGPIFKATLESLQAQTYQNFVIYVCSDGPYNKEYDDIIKDLKDDRFQYIWTGEHRGVGFTRQYLLNYTGMFMFGFTALVDSDDIYNKEYFKTCIQYLITNKSIGFIGSTLAIFDDNPNDPYDVKVKMTTKHYDTHEKIFTKAIFKLPLAGGNSVIYRTQYFKDLKFDTTLTYAEDKDFQAKAIFKSKARFYQIAEPLVAYRKGHSSSVTRNNPKGEQALRIENLKRITKETLEAIGIKGITEAVLRFFVLEDTTYNFTKAEPTEQAEILNVISQIKDVPGLDKKILEENVKLCIDKCKAPEANKVELQQSSDKIKLENTIIASVEPLNLEPPFDKYVFCSQQKESSSEPIEVTVNKAIQTAKEKDWPYLVIANNFIPNDANNIPNVITKDKQDQPFYIGQNRARFDYETNKTKTDWLFAYIPKAVFKQ